MSLRLDRLAFHTLLPLLAHPLAAGAATWLIVREVFVRLLRERAHMAPVVRGILLVLHLGTGFAMLTPARDFQKMDEVPMIRHAAALAEAVPRGTREDTRARPWGMFIEANVAPVPGDGLAAQHDCTPGASGPRRILLAGSASWRIVGPSWTDVVLPDGTSLRVQQPEHVRNAHAWPRPMRPPCVAACRRGTRG